MGSGDLGRELELETVIKALRDEFRSGFEAKFQNPSMVTFRFEHDGPALTLYRTGSFQIRTSGTEERLFESKDRLLKALDSIGVPLESPTFSHLTSVYKYNLGKELNLEHIALFLGLDNIEYEPEQFPGLIYKSDKIETTMLVFGSGKVIIAGATSKESAEESITLLSEELETNLE